MEEKKAKICRFFWPISGSRNFNKFFPLSPIYPQNNGFTLIELLIIIAIIGVLASGLIFLINPAAQMQKAKDSKVKSNLSQIQTALELYRSDCGSYPASITSGGSLSSTCSGPTITYLQVLPPFTNYTPGSGNQTYTLRGCLEWNDPQVTTTLTSCTTSHDKVYVVTSP